MARRNSPHGAIGVKLLLQFSDGIPERKHRITCLKKAFSAIRVFELILIPLGMPAMRSDFPWI